MAPVSPPSTTLHESVNFNSLSLVEKPDSPLNSSYLPETLEGCEGFLRSLPLQSPNADSKEPSTVARMVNILTRPGSDARFEAAKHTLEDDPGNHNHSNRRSHSRDRKEGQPHAVYQEGSPVMKSELKKLHPVHSKPPGVLGFVTRPGCISFYSMEGKTYAVPEGRWWLMKSPIKANWFPNFLNQSLNKDHIAVGEVHVVRVLPGEVGLIQAQGSEVLLDVGTHVFNSGTVSYVGKISFSGHNYFHHGRYHYLRVERGNFAKVWAVVNVDGVDTVVPRLLGEGLHFVDHHLFKFQGFVACSEKVIQHGSIQRISVVKGQLAKCVQDGKSRILGEGVHVIESTDFEFIGFEDVTRTHFIVFGTITILRVVRGKIALAWRDNEPVFIETPGLYEFDSPDFSFDSFRDAEERLIQLGAKKIVHVQTGQVGVTYDDGVLKVLKEGSHEISSSTWIVHGFLSTQEKSIRLATLSAKQRHAKKVKGSSKTSSLKTARLGKVDSNQFSETMDVDSDLTICETKDLVKVGIRADVFYSVSDPEKCIMKIDTDELEDLVRETAVATLTNIIRSTALNEIAQSQNVSAGNPALDEMAAAGAKEDNGPPSFHDLKNGWEAKSSADGSNPPPSAPMAEFFEKTHDAFMSKLHDDFRLRYGVTISNIRIEAFKIMDTDLAEQISKHALTTAQIENEMANLEGMSLISTQKEKTAAEVKNISALAEAEALKTAADSENQRKIDAALAAAEALRVNTKARAEAEAEAVLLKAKAEAEAIRLKAAAEAERAEIIAKTDLGKQEALLKIYSDMVVRSNGGVEKVVYLDPSVNKESPFALSSMHNLNQDLHSLSKLGLAASEANGNVLNQ